MSELERWEGRYADEGYLFGTEPSAFLARQEALLEPGARCLAIADGEGRNGVWLARRGLDVVSQDFSPRAQEKARKLAAARQVALRFELSDLAQRDWEEDAFDVVVGIFFQFLGPAERDAVFAGIARTLRPGGLLLIEGYGPRQIEYATGGPGKLENLYTQELLRGAFGDFARLDIRAYDAEVAEGSGHRGMSALIDLVGRR